MATKLDKIREELCTILDGIPEFKKSTRGAFLYNAKDDTGEKVKVQFKGNNFKMMVGQYEVPVKSIPLSKLKVPNVECFLKHFLVRHTPKEN